MSNETDDLDLRILTAIESGKHRFREIVNAAATGTDHELVDARLMALRADGLVIFDNDKGWLLAEGDDADETEAGVGDESGEAAADPEEEPDADPPEAA